MSDEHPTPRSLWHNRDFTIFWLAQTVSVAGSAFSYVAIPLLVLHATGSVAQMGLLTGLAGAAQIVTGLFAGVVVDRVDRRTLMIVCSVLQAVLYGLIPLGWLFGPQVWLLYLVAPACSAIAMVFRVGYVAVVPNLVESTQITAANGRLSSTSAGANVLGPVLAGVVAAVAGPTAAVLVDAVSFALSALGLAFVRLRIRPAGTAPAAPGSADRTTGWWPDFLVGVRFLWRHPVLRAMTVVLSAFTFLTFGLTDLFVYHLKHDLGQSDGVVGYVLGAAAIGTIGGALLVAQVRRLIGFGACWIGGVTLAGAVLAAMSLPTSVPVLTALLITYMFSTTIGAICSMSLRQEVTPGHLLGRVTSAFWTIHFALGPVGAALLTAGAAHYGSGPVLLVVGAGCVVVAGFALLTPVRQARPERITPPTSAPRAVGRGRPTTGSSLTAQSGASPPHRLPHPLVAPAVSPPTSCRSATR